MSQRNLYTHTRKDTGNRNWIRLSPQSPVRESPDLPPPGDRSEELTPAVGTNLVLHNMLGCSTGFLSHASGRYSQPGPVGMGLNDNECGVVFTPCYGERTRT